MLDKLQFPIDADRSKFTIQQDSILGIFCNTIVKTSLEVSKTDKKLSIITITVKSINELFAKNFTEKLAVTVSNFYIDTKTKKSVQNVNILQHQTDSVRHELNTAITGTASSADATPNANPNKLILRVPSQHRQVDVTANQAILTQLVQNLEFAKVTLRRETPLIQVIDTPILPLEKITIGKLKAIVIGIFWGVFAISLWLILRKLFKDVMTEIN